MLPLLLRFSVGAAVKRMPVALDLLAKPDTFKLPEPVLFKTGAAENRTPDCVVELL